MSLPSPPDPESRRRRDGGTSSADSSELSQEEEEEEEVVEEKIPDHEAPKKSLMSIPVTQLSEKTPTDWRVMSLICLYLGIAIGAETAFGSWLYAYLVASVHDGGLGLNTNDAAYINSVLWLAVALGRALVIAPVARYVSAVPLLCFTQIIAAIGMSILLWFPPVLQLAWIGTLVVGFGISAFFPIGMGLAREYVA